MGRDILLSQKNVGTVDDELLVLKQYRQRAEKWAQSLKVPLKLIRVEATWARLHSTDRTVRITIYSGNVPDNERNRRRLPEAFEGR